MSEIKNGFTSGVSLGGLRTRNEIKILICFIVDRLETPITKSQLNEVICGEEIANYFELNQAFEEVLVNNHIRCDSNDLLYITEIGKKNLKTLEHDIPYTVREKALNCAIRIQLKTKREQENKIEIERKENGCNVTLSVLDNDEKLMSVTIFVADYEQALAVKERFLDDPVKIYTNIVSLLLA